MVLIVGLLTWDQGVRLGWELKCETTAPAGVSSPHHPPPSPWRRLGQGVLWFSHPQGGHRFQAPREPQAPRGSSSALSPAHTALGQGVGGGDTWDTGCCQAGGWGDGALAWARRGSSPALSLKGTQHINVGAERRQELAHLGGQISRTGWMDDLWTSEYIGGWMDG